MAYGWSAFLREFSTCPLRSRASRPATSRIGGAAGEGCRWAIGFDHYPAEGGLVTGACTLDEARSLGRTLRLLVIIGATSEGKKGLVSLIDLLSSTSLRVLDGPLAFAIGATELFAATLRCGRALSLGLTVTIAAAWLIILSTWPLFVMPKTVTLWMFTPTLAEILSVSVIVTTAVLFIGQGPIWRSIRVTAIAFLALTHIVLGSPTSIVLVVPVIAISAGIAEF
jgi:hypothetical protein